MTATKSILLAGLLSLFAASSFAQSPRGPELREATAHQRHGHHHHHHKHHHHHHGHRGQGK